MMADCIDQEHAQAKVRSLYMRMLFQAVRKLPNYDHCNLAKRLDSIEQKIDATPYLSWAPFELNYEFTSIICEELGRLGMKTFFRRAFVSVWDTSILRATIQFALKIGGRDVQVAVRNFNRGFSQLFRGVGSMSVTESQLGRILVEHRDFPNALFENDKMYFESIIGAMSSLFDYADLEGTVDLVLDEIDDGTNRIHYLLRY